ncbi:MAG: hypothetical protein RL222_1084, partial [Bacteroidota bacterium]
FAGIVGGIPLIDHIYYILLFAWQQFISLFNFINGQFFLLFFLLVTR